MNQSGRVIYKQQLALADTDLRDPKLTLLPNGNLLLLAYARRPNASKSKASLGNNSPIIWKSQDGLSWSSPRNIGAKHWWLWRVRWYRQSAYGLAYNRSANAVHLFTGDGNGAFQRLKSNVFCLQTHKKGYPNESDMCFDEKGTAFVILRRDSDSFSAQFGQSKPPYTQWKWTDLGLYLGGPNMLMLNEKNALLSGRVLHKGKIVTGILTIELKTAKVTLVHILPSAGDNSYPGMVIKENTLFVSYYSSHQDNQAHIYLATLIL
jgi:hypothetical protein